jgi:hypothetical protein
MKEMLLCVLQMYSIKKETMVKQIIMEGLSVQTVAGDKIVYSKI